MASEAYQSRRLKTRHGLQTESFGDRSNPYETSFGSISDHSNETAVFEPAEEKGIVSKPNQNVLNIMTDR